jgi:hypothetical protein
LFFFCLFSVFFWEEQSESLWQCGADWIVHPLSPPDSQIFGEFPGDSSQSFERKNFEIFYGGAVAMVSKSKNFSPPVRRITQTL